MKSYIIVAALSVLTGGLSAQTSIEDVLRSCLLYTSDAADE